MADVSRVQRLLDELLDSGCTPEVVSRRLPRAAARGSPALAANLRRRGSARCAVPNAGRNPHAETSTPSHAGADLPRIPGYRFIDVWAARSGRGLARSFDSVVRADGVGPRRWGGPVGLRGGLDDDPELTP